MALARSLAHSYKHWRAVESLRRMKEGIDALMETSN